MPQQRILLAADERACIERVHARASAPPVWSPVYRAPTGRWVLPAEGAVEWQGDSESTTVLLADELVALHVAAGAPYRLRPDGVAGGRISVVVSQAEPVAVPAAARVLTPRALWCLRLQWRAAQAGRLTAAQGAAQLHALLANLPALLTGASEPAPVARTRRLLRTEAGRAARLEEIAEHAHCSPFHLARRFKAYTGIGIHAWRQRLRLAAALARLEQGERDLAGLAHDLGFASQSHLGAVFVRAIGVTPGQARRALTA